MFHVFSPQEASCTGGLAKLFDAKVFANCQRLVPVVTKDMLQTDPPRVDWLRPFLICEDDAKALLGGLWCDETLVKEAAEAKSSFSVSEERRHPLKGKGKIDIADASLNNRIATKFEEAFHKSGNLLAVPPDSGDDGMQRLAKLTKPDIFAQKAQKAQASFEHACLPAMRWTLSGPRQIIFVNFPQLGDLVRTKLGGQALRHPINSHATMQWLSQCGPEHFTAMVEANPHLILFKCSTGPGEVLYTPAAWLKLELPSEDNIVVRLTLLPGREAAKVASDLKIVAADLMSQGKKNLALDAVLRVVQEHAKVEACAGAPSFPKAGEPTPGKEDTEPARTHEEDTAQEEGTKHDEAPSGPECGRPIHGSELEDSGKPEASHE